MAVTPHVLDKVIDSDGNIISRYNSPQEKLVISESVAKAVTEILEEGVSGDGGAKNAGVDGYKIAAKTGTSQKFDVLDANGNSYLRIGSTVAYSLDKDKGVAAIIVVDEPTSTLKYGSVVAAPYISNLFSKILPYLEFESTEEKLNVEVDNYVGLSVDEAKEMLTEQKINYEIIGNGDRVISQTPGSYDVITSKNAKIILYTTDDTEKISVPNLTGISIDEAVKKAINSGLNIKIRGNNGGTVISQSLPIGALVERGSVITLEVLVTDFED